MKTADPELLNRSLIENYIQEIPVSIETVDDMIYAGHMMAMITNDYSYLLGVLSTFKIWAKIAKVNGSKAEYNDMVMRRDSIETIVDILKQQYSALSRLITIKQEINNELKMTMN